MDWVGLAEISVNMEHQPATNLEKPRKKREGKMDGENSSNASSSSTTIASAVIAFQFIAKSRKSAQRWGFKGFAECFFREV